MEEEKMRLPFVAAMIVILSLVACNGPQPTESGVDAQDSPVETPEHTWPSPSEVPQTPEVPENTLVDTPEYTGVIVSEEGALAFRYLFDQASTAFWEPSSDDIAEAENCIRQFLISAQDAYQQESVAFILENLERYRRQYVGIVVDGEKRIWCNLFLSDSFPNWQWVPVDVDDGGKHFWQIEYLLLEDECTNFYLHGEA
jgi:hypothetical protein